jgi:hypothetical protein
MINDKDEFAPTYNYMKDFIWSQILDDAHANKHMADRRWWSGVALALEEIAREAQKRAEPEIDEITPEDLPQRPQ